MKRYKNRKGELQWMPSLEQLERADANYEGFCLACGTTHRIEPDAHGDECPSCGKPKLFGAMELMLMGVYH